MGTRAYVVALRRERRASCPEDWAQQLSAIDGVQLVGHTGHVAKVVADASGVQEIRRRLGDLVLVEAEIEHRRL